MISIVGLIVLHLAVYPIYLLMRSEQRSTSSLHGARAAVKKEHHMALGLISSMLLTQDVIAYCAL